MIKYVTSEGDTVDYIAWKQFGSQSGRITERLLSANPGLAEMGAILPRGIIVYLPELPAVEAKTGIKLWT